jgi:hypothetical protein
VPVLCYQVHYVLVVPQEQRALSHLHIIQTIQSSEGVTCNDSGQLSSNIP